MSGNQVIEKPPENGQNIHKSEPKCVQEETNKISSHETLKNDIKSILESVENSITKKSPVKRLKSANEDVNRENRIGLFSDIPSVFEKSKRITENKLQCNVCLKLFTTRDNRRHHFEETHSKLSCGICNLTFKSKKNLIEHKNRIHSKLLCKICYLTFTSNNSLTAHENSAHLNLKCRTCNSSFQDHKTLYEHFQTVHQNEKEKKGNFKAKRSRKYPNDHKIGDPVFQDYPNCIECGLVYRDQESLKEHIYSTHTKIKEIMQSMSNKKCKYCGHKFNKFKSLYEHKCEINQTKQSVNLKEVEYVKEGKTVLADHERKRSDIPMETENSPEDKNYEIENSDDTLEIQSYNSDILTHEASEFFEVNDPLKLEESIRQRDLKLFSDGRYNCQLCCATFSQGKDSQMHFQSHEAEKSSDKRCENIELKKKEDFLESDKKVEKISHRQAIKCKTCEIVFCDEDSLMKHFRAHPAHIGELYKCGQCGESFNRFNNFGEHIREHKLEICRLCGVSFRIFKNLYEHICEDQVKKMFKMNTLVNIMRTKLFKMNILVNIK